MFKVAKQMRKDKRDVQGAKYVEDENGEIKVAEREVREREMEKIL